MRRVARPPTEANGSADSPGAVTSNKVLRILDEIHVRELLRLIADHFDGPKGIWAYDAFDVINDYFFDANLPTPKIQWALTAHGRCLALTSIRAKPIVTLHPSLFGGTESENPWHVPGRWLGALYAFDVLLHEAIHIAQYILHDGGVGPTSHNNTAWIAEVNRLAPMLGLDGIEAGLSTTKRVKVPGQFTPKGRPLTRVVRASQGNVPHAAIATFPYGVRMLQKTALVHYRNVTCNCMLHGLIPESGFLRR
jgi:hypothetical protein